MTGQGGEGELHTEFRLDADGALRGFVLDPEVPDRRFVVEILADGLPVALVRSIEYRAGLAAGDGCHGFAVRLGGAVLAGAERVEARLANAAAPFGRLLGPFAAAPAVGPPPGLGAVRWSGGLTLAGWRAGDGPQPPVVKALVDGREVARTACRGWVEVADGGAMRVARGFVLRLPRRFADGRVQTVEVLAEDGTPLEGSPLLAFALADGFADVVDRFAEIESERVRARFADGLLPQAVPFSAFEPWRDRFPPRPAPSGAEERFVVIVVGEGGLDATLASLEGQHGCDWRVAVLPSAGSAVSFPPLALRKLLGTEAGDCDLFVATVAGAVFRPDALALLADAARRFPSAAALYGDLGPGQGADGPLGFPAFDEELFLEQGYSGLCFAMRPAIARSAHPDTDSLFALFPFPDPGSPAPAPETPVHLPAVLCDLPRLTEDRVRSSLAAATARRLTSAGIDAEVVERSSPVPAVRVRRRPAASASAVSILVATRDDGAALAATLESVTATCGTIELDVVIADGGSRDPGTLSRLAELRRARMRVLDMDGWSSTARRLDAAARAARCDHILFLEAGLIAREAGWLGEMLSRATAPRCGAVGALIASPRGVVRHAGFVLGPRFSAVDRFGGSHVSETGHAGWLDVAQEVSAVSIAGMLTGRRDFEAVGGFDALRFPTSFFDVDYCLRLRAAGRRVLFTPDARLELDRWDPRDGSALRQPFADRQRAVLAERWRLVPGCDPFYSPWMAADGPTHSGLAWPPPPFEARQPHAPTPFPSRVETSEDR